MAVDARKLTTTQLLAVEIRLTVGDQFITLHSSDLFQRLQADMHRLQPMHLTVSSQLAVAPRLGDSDSVTDPSAA